MIIANVQAALMLAESILHAFVDRRAITTEEALSVVVTVQDAKEEVSGHSADTHATVAELPHLLGLITTSLEPDLN